jgi:hypothetical protein
MALVANTNFEYGITCIGDGILHIAGSSGGIAANELAAGSSSAL